jgi:hypothetical protein
MYIPIVVVSHKATIHSLCLFPALWAERGFRHVPEESDRDQEAGQPPLNHLPQEPGSHRNRSGQVSQNHVGHS